MKIQKFNEITLKPAKVYAYANYPEDQYPVKCKFKDRIPDPGICTVISINFEDRELDWSNRRVRSTASFDDVEFIPDIFEFSKYNL